MWPSARLATWRAASGGEIKGTGRAGAHVRLRIETLVPGIRWWRGAGGPVYARDRARTGEQALYAYLNPLVGGRAAKAGRSGWTCGWGCVRRAARRLRVQGVEAVHSSGDMRRRETLEQVDHGTTDAGGAVHVVPAPVWCNSERRYRLAGRPTSPRMRPIRWCVASCRPSRRSPTRCGSHRQR